MLTFCFGNFSKRIKGRTIKSARSIINVHQLQGSSLSGAAYATSKAALGALTREMSKDFGPLGVRVMPSRPEK